MHIETIQLQNVGVFAGIQEIDLRVKTAKRPVVLIGGLNGCGKTTLLESILLALYGKLSPAARNARASYESYLESLMTTGADGASAVELAFRVHEGTVEHRYLVRRSWVTAGKRIREDLEVQVDGCYDELLSSNWAEAVDRFLPQRLAGLFFFDGEKIAKLADPKQAPKLLQTAIHSLLGVELVDQLEADLSVLVRRKSKDLAPEEDRAALDSLETRISELERDRGAAKQEVAAMVDPLERDRQAVEHAEEDLRERGGDFAGQRQSLVIERDRLEQRATELRSGLRELAAGPLPLSLIRPQLEAIISDLGAQAQVGDPVALAKWIGDRDQRFIERLRELGLDPETLTKIDAVLGEDRAEISRSDRSKDARATTFACIDRIRALVSGVLDTAVEQGRSLLEEVDAATIRLAEVERLLTAMPSEEDLAKMVKQLQTAEERHRRKLREFEGREAKYQSIDRELEIANARYEREWKASKSEQLGQGDIVRFLKHADKAQGIIRTFRTRLVERHSQRLEALILEGYHLLLRKDGLIREIKIDPTTCEIELRGRHEQVLDLERLSAGERQLLATAMLWGLARAAGRPLPVIIDTPLARLDSAHKTHFVQRYLPQASHQVLVLSTDSEIHGEYYDILKPVVSREYRLDHDDTTGSTRVNTGYFQSEVTHAD